MLASHGWRRGIRAEEEKEGLVHVPQTMWLFLIMSKINFGLALETLTHNLDCAKMYVYVTSLF